jgi:hypothetical protein
VIARPTKISDSTWHHLVVVADTIKGDLSKVSFYADGKLLSTSCISVINGTFSTTSTNPMVIGSYYNHQFRYFCGILDDLRIYSRAITPNEIQSLYQEGLCVKSITVTDTLLISFVTGLNELPENFGLMKVYPNPSHSSITLDAQNTTGNYSVKITNSTGASVYSHVVTQKLTQINLSSLGSSGIYFLQVLDIDSKVLETKKLVLE